MPNVSVEISAVSGAIALCQQSIQQFQQTASGLTRSYQSAGSTWRDQKYQQLGSIVSDCSSALNKPVQELSDCIQKLTALRQAIQEYEETSL